MDGHFRAVSFVDRIARIEGGSVRGQYAIPPGLEAFSSSLVNEAVGQLAAWAAMAAVDFTHRPVAGIAGRIELLSPVRPGQLLELSADLESVDTEAVGYSGAAHVDGRMVARLSDCVGPMVSVDEFDDPQAVRDRFSLLKGRGAAPGAFPGLLPLPLLREPGETGRVARATLQVPAEAPFFSDHFPRRPVFPGTLLMQANLETALLLSGEITPGSAGAWVPRSVSDVKLRTFISPGATVHVEAKRSETEERSLQVNVESRIGQKLISSAQVEFSREVER